MPERRTGNCVFIHIWVTKPNQPLPSRKISAHQEYDESHAEHEPVLKPKPKPTITPKANEKNIPLISNQDFLERIQSVCPIKTQIISIYDCYHCGVSASTQSAGMVVRIIRQTGLYEFVVFCPKGYLTLIEYSFDVHDVRSILSTKTNNHAALAQMEERPGSNL